MSDERTKEVVMGKGIDMAREDAPIHASVLDDLKDQILIVLMKRLGGNLTIPVEEVDDTSQDLVMFSVDAESRTLHFEVVSKS
jgi:hypothetical protein